MAEVAETSTISGWNGIVLVQLPNRMLKAHWPPFLNIRRPCFSLSLSVSQGADAVERGETVQTMTRRGKGRRGPSCTFPPPHTNLGKSF